jgi:hypothetical protein
MKTSRKRSDYKAWKIRPAIVSRSALWGIAFALVASFTCAFFVSRTGSNVPVGAKSPATLAALLALNNQDLEDTDIALMNLLCAEGLPGAERLSVADSLTLLDQLAQHAKREIERNRHRFHADPAYFHHSEAFYQMLILAVVVYEDFKIRYNPKWITAPAEISGPDHFFADSRDILLHGLTGPQRMGTCSSMPVLYLALGRRLGYPLKLVTTRQHLFLRWESPTERFNLEATGKGMERYDDAHYRQWPFPISEQEIQEQDYLKSLSAQEELSVFLFLRGACLTEADRLAEATTSFEAAYRCAPNWKGNQVLLAEARQRQGTLVTGRPPVTEESPAVSTVFDPLRPYQNQKVEP